MLVSTALVLPGASSPEAHARSYEVSLLKGTEKDGVWGTEAYQVSITGLGQMRHVTVAGKELLWQAAALYTSPMPPGSEESVRTVQGEGVGGTGLSVEAPVMECREDKGRRVFLFHHFVANKKVLDGKRLCQVDQEIVLTPTGEISVRILLPVPQQ